MPFVLDASIAACWAFADEQDPRADVALERVRIEEAVVPSLWWFEVRNILVVNDRRKANHGARHKQLSSRTCPAPDPGGSRTRGNTVLRLARFHRLSVYDASYLELALREGTPMATLDAELAAAATAEATGLIGATS